MRRCGRTSSPGRFVSNFIAENAVGQPFLQGHPPPQRRHQIEAVGEEARAMMPWIGSGKLVDKAKN